MGVNDRGVGSNHHLPISYLSPLSLSCIFFSLFTTENSETPVRDGCGGKETTMSRSLLQHRREGDLPDYGAISSSTSLPDTLLNSRIVIAGGGPVGLFAAIMLQSLGHRNVTILERASKDAGFDTNRTYCFALNTRGKAVTGQVPGLLDHLLQFTPVEEYKICLISKQGRARVHRVSDFVKNFKPGAIFYRPRFLYALADFGHRKFEGSVETIFDANVTDVSFSRENGGTSTVHYTQTNTETGEEEECSITADLLLGCDGKNSKVVAGLRKANPEIVQSRKGFGARLLTSPAVGRLIRSFIVDPSIYEDLPDVPKDHATTVWSNLAGDFRFDILPMLPEDIESLGGLLVSVSDVEDSPIWKITTAEEAYQVFSNSFPQINFRKYVTPEALDMFVKGRSVQTTSITQLHSLGARVGENGGVVVMGDAAHCIPSDSGQGLNSGLEDAAELIVTALNSRDSGSVGDIVMEYDCKRMPDVVALAEIATFGGDTKDTKSKFDTTRRKLDRIIRTKANALLPQFFHPVIGSMNSDGLRYSASRRYYKITTWRLIGVFVLLFALIVWLVVWVIKLIVGLL